MKLISLEHAVVSYLFAIEEIRPLHGVRGADFVLAAQQRYQFMEVPDVTRPYNEIADGPVKFFGGSIGTGLHKSLIKELSLFRDGIVATAHQTDEAERLILDFLDWGRREFNFREPSSTVKKNYLSTLVVEFDIDIELIFTPLIQIRKLLLPFYKKYRRVEGDINLKRLAFGIDSTKYVQGQLIADFSLERRIDQPHETNRYICELPVPTDDAIEILKEFEKIIT